PHRPAAPPCPRGLRRSRSHLVRRGAVPLVHAAARRASGERHVRPPPAPSLNDHATPTRLESPEAVVELEGYRSTSGWRPKRPLRNDGGETRCESWSWSKPPRRPRAAPFPTSGSSPR